jgi:hypothetical protein
VPFSFPASPSVGATSTQNGRQYVYAGNNAWELAAASGGGSVTIPASGDQYFDDTLLLMRMNSSAGDLSLYRVTFTSPPGAFSTTAKFGTHSYNVNRQTGFTSTSKLIPDISTGDWTVEAWVYRQTADDTYAAIIFLNAASVASSASSGGLNIYINQDGSVVQNNGLAGSLNGGGVAVGAWTHIAVVMSSGVSKLYVNGTSVATGSQQPVAGPYWANIGYVQTSSPTFASDLLIDDLRVTKAARYTANFTPPTATHSIAPYVAAQTVTGSGGGSGLSWSSVPASATATGTAGSISYDGSYFYLAPAQNTWFRAPLSPWNWSPSAIAGLAAWWDFSDASSITLNGGNISQINDKSGSGRTATQATDNNQPALTSSAMNGLSMATFNNSTSHMVYGTDLFTYSGAATVFVVCRDISAEIADYPAFVSEYRAARQSVMLAPTLYDASTNRGFRPGLDCWAGQIYDTTSAYGSPTQTSPAILQYHWHNWSTAHNDGATLIGLNNDGVALTSRGSSAQSFSGAASQRIIGGAFGGSAVNFSSVLNGKVGEILVWTTALTATQRALVRTYLSTKWAISLS